MPKRNEMQIIDIREFEESVVLHYGGPFKRINAYTLASSLVAIADATKAANEIINPGYSVEVVVEAFAEGSFKAKIKTIYKGANNLFSAQTLKSIAIGVISAYVYQHTLAPDIEIKIKVDSEHVIIEQEDKKIIIPRTVHDALKEVEKSKKFSQGISKTFEAIQRDKNIESFGFTKNLEDETPPVKIPRQNFPMLTEFPETELSDRVVEEKAELQISKAILERSKRKWEFSWRGVKISAPILDPQFYDEFFAHKITIAPGDILEVNLKIHQTCEPDSGIFTNSKYEVTQVITHKPRPLQSSMLLADSGENEKGI
jgi:hypothetical protein